MQPTRDRIEIERSEMSVRACVQPTLRTKESGALTNRTKNGEWYVCARGRWVGKIKSRRARRVRSSDDRKDDARRGARCERYVTVEMRAEIGSRAQAMRLGVAQSSTYPLPASWRPRASGPGPPALLPYASVRNAPRYAKASLLLSNGEMGYVREGNIGTLRQ